MSSRRRSLVLFASAAVLAGTAVAAGPAAAGGPSPTGHHPADTTLVPIGGGYEAVTAQQLMTLAARTASGPTLDILVVPSSYGDAPEDRETNLAQAQVRTDQLDAHCEAVIDHSKFTGCTAGLLTLLNRADALDPANSAALDNPGLDTVFVLGGDQVLAMKVLANSPAEAALSRAHSRGVVVSGTSAGNAVESLSMITGYTPDGYPETGLQKASVTVGWGDDLASDDRGLEFGSQRFIFDQHFYQRGRMGRLLNITAQSVDHFGRSGKLGLGADYATAPVVTDDRRVEGVIGLSSVTIFDFQTASKPRWVGADQTVSVRNVLTHVIAPGAGMTYDAAGRDLELNGRDVRIPRAKSLPELRVSSRGSLLLGGGGNADAESAVLRSFVKSAKGSRVVVLAGGYADQAAAAAAGDKYSAALAGAGWNGSVTVLVQGRDRIDSAAVRGAAGVLVIGGDQSLIGPAVADRGFAAAVRSAVQASPVVLTDGAMTAAMAEKYNAVASPDSDNYEDEAIRYFRSDAQTLQRGFGLVRGVTLEPVLTYDYRWGLVFGAAAADRSVALGISEYTALSVRGNTSTVVGERSVVSVDGRAGRFGTGSNGALTAANVYLSTFAAGDRLR